MLFVSYALSLCALTTDIQRKRRPPSPPLQLAVAVFADDSRNNAPLAYPADCRSGATTRACTAFEEPPCLCPGKGTVKRFSLTIQYVNITGLLSTPRRLISANGTVPGPAITANQGALRCSDNRVGIACSHTSLYEMLQPAINSARPLCHVGDWVIVAVTNALDTGTLLHWCVRVVCHCALSVVYALCFVTRDYPP